MVDGLRALGLFWVGSEQGQSGGVAVAQALSGVTHAGQERRGGGWEVGGLTAGLHRLPAGLCLSQRTLGQAGHGAAGTVAPGEGCLTGPPACPVPPPSAAPCGWVW